VWNDRQREQGRIFPEREENISLGRIKYFPMKVVDKEKMRPGRVAGFNGTRLPDLII
jgi:hypothetical protein